MPTTIARLFLLATCAGSALALPEFDRADYAAGPMPIAVAPGDFDGDGDLDLAIVNAGSPAGLSILTNNGHAHFAVSQFLPIPTGMTDPTDVVALDFDHDGDLDLAETIAHAGGVNFSVVRLFANTGAGTFVQSQVQTGYGPNCVVAGDINGNGAQDLATANLLADGWTMLFNNGSGTFTPNTRIIQPDPRAINLGDIDNDGDLDVALSWLHGLVIGFNNGSGAFLAGDLYTFGVRPDALAFGDVEHDGDLDLAVADYNGNSVYLLSNNGAGAFSLLSQLSVQTGPGDVKFADLNGDTAVDLMMTSVITSQLEIRWNDGEGGFTETQLVPTGTQPIEMGLGDFDADGTLDIVVVNSGSGTISVFTRPNCPADFNNDGVLDFFDVSAFLAAFAGHAPHADFTGDGVFDFFDVSAFLSLFSAGCA